MIERFDGPFLSEWYSPLCTLCSVRQCVRGREREKKRPESQLREDVDLHREERLDLSRETCVQVAESLLLNSVSVLFFILCGSLIKKGISVGRGGKLGT